MPEQNGNEKSIPSGLIPFQPGVSGNPGGRPKYASLSKAARVQLEEINPETGLTHAQQIVKRLILEAERGNVWAARELREWTEGKVTHAFQQEINFITANSGSMDDSDLSIREKLFRKLIPEAFQDEKGSQEDK